MEARQRVRAKHDGKSGTVREIHEDWDCWLVDMDDGTLGILGDNDVEIIDDDLPVPTFIVGKDRLGSLPFDDDDKDDRETNG